MHSQAAYAIFWAPSGYAFPSGYTTAIEDFLKNVATDSGKPSNVYSVSAQYTDGTRPRRLQRLLRRIRRPTRPPTRPAAPVRTYKGFGESFTACITDAKLEAEVESVVAAQGWPRRARGRVLRRPPAPRRQLLRYDAGTECFDKQFCAYHSFSASRRSDLRQHQLLARRRLRLRGRASTPTATPTATSTTPSAASATRPTSRSPTRAERLVRRRRLRERRRVPKLQRRLRPAAGRLRGHPLQPVDRRQPLLPPAGVEQRRRTTAPSGSPPATPSIADPGPSLAGQSASFDGSGSVARRRRHRLLRLGLRRRRHGHRSDPDPHLRRPPAPSPSPSRSKTTAASPTRPPAK